MPMDQEIPALLLHPPRKPLPSPRFRLTHDFQIRKRRLQPRHHQSHVGCQRSQQITPISFVGACSSHQGVSGAPYSGASFHSPFPALDFEFPSRLQLSCRSSIATTSPHSSSSPFSCTYWSTPRGTSVHPPNLRSAAPRCAGSAGSTRAGLGPCPPFVRSPSSPSPASPAPACSRSPAARTPLRAAHLSSGQTASSP